MKKFAIILLLIIVFTVSNAQEDDKIVADVSFDSTSTYIAMSKMDGVHIKRISDMQTVQFLSSPVATLQSVWSDDGSKIAGVGSDKIIRIWDTTTGVLLETLESSLWIDRIDDIVWYEDRLYSLGLEGPFIIWDTTTYQIVHTSSLAGQELELSPDKTKLAIGVFAGVRILDITSLEYSARLSINAQLWSIAWKPDGQKIAIGAVDGIVRIWDLTTQSLETTLNLDDGSSEYPIIVDIQWRNGYIAISVVTSLNQFIFEDDTYTLLDMIEVNNAVYAWDSEGRRYIVYNRFTEQTIAGTYCSRILSSEDITGLSQEINSGNTDPLGNVICLSPNATYTLTSPLPNVFGDITLIGNGASIVMAGAGRLFDVASTGGLTLKNLTVSGGDAVRGGGIYNAGVLSLEDVVLESNNADEGGAIYNVGTLTMRGGALQNNVGRVRGGGIYNAGDMDLDGVNIRDNDAPEGSGVYQG